MVFFVFVATSISSKKRSGPKPEFPGLTQDAAALGVSRYFLWQVLKGHAASKPLLTRYLLRKANTSKTSKRL